MILVSSSDWDIFLLPSKEQSASWDAYFQGAPLSSEAFPFYEVSRKKPEAFSSFLSWHVVGSSFFSLKFKKKSLQVGVLEQKRSSFLQSLSSTGCRELCAVRTLWFLWCLDFIPGGVSWMRFQKCEFTSLLLWFVSVDNFPELVFIWHHAFIISPSSVFFTS